VPVSAGLIYENDMDTIDGWNASGNAALEALSQGTFLYVQLDDPEGDPASMTIDTGITIQAGTDYELTTWMREADNQIYAFNGNQFLLALVDLTDEMDIVSTVVNADFGFNEFLTSFSTAYGMNADRVGHTLGIKVGTVQANQTLDTLWVGVQGQLGPEPASLILLGGGLVGIIACRRK
jgi:hypothetical protein